MNRVEWTPDRTERLVSMHAQGFEPIEIAEALGRRFTAQTVRRKACRLGIRKGRCPRYRAPWTDEQQAEAAGMWQAGASPAMIADHFSTTPSTVLSRLERLGVIAIGRPRQMRGRLVDKKTLAKREPAPAGDYEVLERAFRPLKHNTCHWPIGDPCGEDFRFCCEFTLDTYCERHARMSMRREP